MYMIYFDLSAFGDFQHLLRSQPARLHLELPRMTPSGLIIGMILMMYCWRSLYMICCLDYSSQCWMKRWKIYSRMPSITCEPAVQMGCALPIIQMIFFYYRERCRGYVDFLEEKVRTSMLLFKQVLQSTFLLKLMIFLVFCSYPIDILSISFPILEQLYGSLYETQIYYCSSSYRMNQRVQ